MAEHLSGGRRRRGRRIRVVTLVVVLAAVAAGLRLVFLWGPPSAWRDETGEPLEMGETEAGDASTALGFVEGDKDEDASADDSQAADVQVDAPNEPVEIDLLAVGDVLQHQRVWESGLQADGSYNFDHVFANLGDALEGEDLKVINQESILGGEVAPFSSYPSFNGPQEMGDAEVKAGFNVILRASNHTMDVGYEGLWSELAFWKSRHPDVAVLGAVDPDEAGSSAEDVYVYEKDGFLVALLNYTYGLNGYSDPKGAVSMLEEGHVRTTLAKAREQADLVVVFPHWGEEYQTQPVEEQRAWERLLVEQGADVIIGSHPHVIEPVETFERVGGGTGVCFWSLGNFVSGQVDNETLVGGMARVTLRKGSDGTCSVVAASLEPVITHKGMGSAMTVYRLRDYTDELAATNGFPGVSNVTLTPAWAQDFCSSVLGDEYDRGISLVSVPLGIT